jgi:hypothetical protein
MGHTTVGDGPVMLARIAGGDGRLFCVGWHGWLTPEEIPG